MLNIEAHVCNLYNCHLSHIRITRFNNCTLASDNKNVVALVIPDEYIYI